MKQSLQIKASQNLALTPQLQQAIKLLQLSSIELQTEIQNAIEENPLLEIEETQDTITVTEETNTSETELKLDSDNIPKDLPVDSSWDTEYEPTYSSPTSDSKTDFTEYTSGTQVTLQSFLKEQIDLLNINDVDKYAALIIIDSLDNNGFLTDSKDNLFALIQQKLPHYEHDEFTYILNLIQNLEPFGVATSGPSESMCLQLKKNHHNSPFVDLSLKLLTNHLELITNHDYARIKKAMKINDDKLQGILNLIKSLNPRPGNSIGSETTEYIIPDVYITLQNSRWGVSLNTETSPKLSINQYYTNLIKNNKNTENKSFLSGYLQDAKWFIKSLNSRNDTLLKVATSIVEKQQAFMEFGEIQMKPLILKEIAEELGLHESTISRITTKKYMRTPKGTYEFKYFFSSHVSTEAGSQCSATAIKAMLKKLILNELPKKPLSDNKLCNILSENGIKIARRTVAKYRESLNIPPSNERKHI